MISSSKTTFVSDFPMLCRTLQGSKEPTTWCFYGDRIAIKHEVSTYYSPKETSTIRFWKTRSFMDWWIDANYANNFIGIVDYTIYDDYIKIKGLGVNDTDLIGYQDCKLTEKEAQELMKSIIQYIKNIAEQENKPKIILDVHYHLRFYKQYFLSIGFVFTDRTSKYNRFWLEAELFVDLPLYHFK